MCSLRTKPGMRSVLSAVAVASTICSPAAAQATTLPDEGTAEFAAHCDQVTDEPTREIAAAPDQIAAAPDQLVVQASKSVAILGGQPSALEQILAQQSSAGEDQAMTDFAVALPSPPQPLEPALGGNRPKPATCSALFRPQASARSSEDFLATKRLAIGKTAFDRDWQRVSSDRVSARNYRRLLGGDAGNNFSTLGAVNAWVNQAITFTEDRQLFSRADFWAGAAMTLRLRRGDCEDIALTKMHLLAAAGIPREDMILTLARDLVRNADHAVLIVRQGGRYYMLDNASDEVFDASLSHDYRPILSFGRSQTWLHGY